MLADSNRKYKGYCIDMLDRIAQLCNFNYTIKLVDDGKYGALVNGSWNGMVSELLNKVSAFNVVVVVVVIK